MKSDEFATGAEKGTGTGTEQRMPKINDIKLNAVGTGTDIDPGIDTGVNTIELAHGRRWL